MAAIRCPQCGHRGEVPDTFRGQQVRCRQCREKLTVPRSWPIGLLLSAVVLVLLAGAAGAYLLLHRPAPLEEAAVPELPPPVEPTPTRKVDAVAPPAILVVKKEGPSAEEVARAQEEARKKEEAERLALEEARLEKDRQEREARELAVKLFALKKSPDLSVHLEDIEKDPVKYLGKYLTVDRLSIKLTNIARHADLGRYTLGVTSPRGRYFSRAPLGGLVISTTEKAARQLVDAAGPLDMLPRIKIYCEIRQWEKGGKPYPEAFAYRIEVYDNAGRIDAVVEVPDSPP